MDTRIAPERVTVRPSTLFDACCAALESGEFVQIREAFYDEGNGRCAWGVLHTVAGRAGHVRMVDIHPSLKAITNRAGELLGYVGIEEANDKGESFKVIAAALRRARLDIEALTK